MFGGILEITKESEEIFVFHLPSSTWKQIDMNLSPHNLENFFKNIESQTNVGQMQIVVDPLVLQSGRQT